MLLFSFQRRMTSIERSLEEADNLSIKFQELQSSKDKIIVEKDRYVGLSSSFAVRYKKLFAQADLSNVY